MSYSSLAVRYFCAPKPLGMAMDAPPAQHRLEPKIQPSSCSTDEKDGADSAEKRTTANPDAAGSDESSRKKGMTFANQDLLPKLPIPELEDTCRKYLDALAPLQTSREHEETKAAVQDFLKSDGPMLQEKLKAYASSKTSYIEQFCTSLAEFRPRIQ